MNEKILETVLSFMEKYRIEPYDEKTNRGVVRHVLTRYGHTTKEWMVCLVINRTKLPYADALVEELVKLEGMTSISININQKNTNVILGEKVETLWGSPYIRTIFILGPEQTGRWKGMALPTVSLRSLFIR